MTEFTIHELNEDLWEEGYGEKLKERMIFWWKTTYQHQDITIRLETVEEV